MSEHDRHDTSATRRQFLAAGAAAAASIGAGGMLASAAQAARRSAGPAGLIMKEISLGWIDEQGRALDRSFKTPRQGAATQVWAATSPQLRDIGGVYCEDYDIAEVVVGDTVPLRGVRDYAIDPESAARLWALSAEPTGVDAGCFASGAER